MHIEKIYSTLKGLIVFELKTREVIPRFDDLNIITCFNAGELNEIKNEPNIFFNDYYHRYSIEHPKKCVIPDDMFEFYKELNNYIKNVKKPYTTIFNENFTFHEPRTDINTLDSMSLIEGSKKDFLDFIEPDDRAIHLYDYFSFFHDPYSISNGQGSFIINLNIESVHYGNVYSYSSNDEGTTIKMANSFSEFIDCIVCNLDQLKNSEDYPKESICDIFAYNDTAIYPGFKTKPAK